MDHRADLPATPPWRSGPHLAAARRLLEQEGFRYEGYVDIFDAGPVLQARVSELRAMRDSTLAEIGAISDRASACAPEAPADEPMLVSNTTRRVLTAFTRCLRKRSLRAAFASDGTSANALVSVGL